MIQRLVRSALRTADRLVHIPASSPGGLKQFSSKLFLNLKGTYTDLSASAQRQLSTSSNAQHIPSHAHRSPHYYTTLSLPVRTALRRPMTGPFIPRTPIVPRSVTQVGLGTARNFSSTRHIFQNLVDNVPIAARTLVEANWEVKAGKGENIKRRRKNDPKSKKSRKSIDKLQYRVPLSPSSCTSSDSQVEDGDIAHYFTAPADAVEGTTTFLTIPLYPATTERTPLPSVDGSLDYTSRLLPLSDIRSIHTDHALHATRVSSLFTRLDGADVWSRGVECQCYGPGVNLTPTSLQVVFKGWTRERVLAVIGEGWCVLEEIVQKASTPPSTPGAFTPEASFIMPTLDFSSSFLARNVPSVLEESALYDKTPDWTPFTTRPSTPSIAFGSDEEDFSGDDTELWSSGDERAGHSISTAQSLSFSASFWERGVEYSHTPLSNFE